MLLLPDATVAQADRLARSIDPDVRRDDPRRGRALVAWTLARFARDGHTAAPESMVAGGAPPFRGGRRSALRRDSGRHHRLGDRSDWCRRVRRHPTGPTSSDEPWVSPKALADAEASIATHLARLVDSASSLAGDRAIKGVLSGLASETSG